MSSPIIWVFLPALFGLILVLFGGRIRYSNAYGTIFTAVIALAAVFVPVGGAFSIRGVVIQIPTTLLILGRRMVITSEMTWMIMAIYAAAFLWFLSSTFIRAGRSFIGASLICTAVLVGAISFRPWEFVGVFVFFAVLLMVILLTSSAEKTKQGVINFLSFNVIGVPFILIAGSLISGLGSTPPGLPIVESPAFLLGMGFALLLPLFPFHAWLPRLAEEVDPFRAAFVFVFLPAFICILLLQVVDRNVWLRNAEEVFTLFRTIGLITVFFGALFVAFQRNLGRILGFASLIETGLFLLAIGVGPQEAVGLFFAILTSRCLGFLVWGTGLSWIKKAYGSLDFRDVQGAARKHFFPSVAILIATMSSAGLPLLIGYVPRIRLYSALAPLAPSAAVAMWISSIGLCFAAFRSMAVFVMKRSEEESSDSRLGQFRLLSMDFVFVFAITLLFAGGIFPFWIDPLAELLPLAFDHLRP